MDLLYGEGRPMAVIDTTTKRKQAAAQYHTLIVHRPLRA